METQGQGTTNAAADASGPADPPKEPIQEIWAALFEKDWKDSEETLKKNIPLVIHSHWQASKLEGYNPILFLDQSNPIGEEHADRIYAALCGFPEKKTFFDDFSGSVTR